MVLSVWTFRTEPTDPHRVAVWPLEDADAAARRRLRERDAAREVGPAPGRGRRGPERVFRSGGLPGRLRVLPHHGVERESRSLPPGGALPVAGAGTALRGRGAAGERGSGGAVGPAPCALLRRALRESATRASSGPSYLPRPAREPLLAYLEPRAAVTRSRRRSAARRCARRRGRRACRDARVHPAFPGGDPLPQGVVRTADPRGEPARQRTIRGSTAPHFPRPPGERALRSRERRVHRRRRTPRPGVSSSPTTGRCFSTRSASCRCSCRPSCCASSRTARSPVCGRKLTRVHDRFRLLAATQQRSATRRCRPVPSAQISSFAWWCSFFEVPPLRQRRDDLPVLAAALPRAVAGQIRPRVGSLSAEAAAALARLCVARQRPRAGQRSLAALLLAEDGDDIALAALPLRVHKRLGALGDGTRARGSAWRADGRPALPLVAALSGGGAAGSGGQVEASISTDCSRTPRAASARRRGAPRSRSGRSTLAYAPPRAAQGGLPRPTEAEDEVARRRDRCRPLAPYGTAIPRSSARASRVASGSGGRACQRSQRPRAARAARSAKSSGAKTGAP